MPLQSNSNPKSAKKIQSCSKSNRKLNNTKKIKDAKKIKDEIEKEVQFCKTRFTHKRLLKERELHIKMMHEALKVKRMRYLDGFKVNKK